ncbi:MAG: SPOR domain-containing protein [Paracoccaceae bacterium]
MASFEFGGQGPAASNRGWNDPEQGQNPVFEEQVPYTEGEYPAFDPGYEQYSAQGGANGQGQRDSSAQGAPQSNPYASHAPTAGFGPDFSADYSADYNSGAPSGHSPNYNSESRRATVSDYRDDAAFDGAYAAIPAAGNPGASVGATLLAELGRKLGRMTHFAGAAMSIALIAGLGVWGYKLMVRDVSGVPVVRALSGPMRMAPEDPGGRQASHQGLAVNAIAAEGEAEAPADRLVLAPRPVELADEDRPVAEMRAAATVEALQAQLAAADTAPIEANAEAGEVLAAPSNDPVQAALDFADQISADVTPLSGAAIKPGADIATTAAADALIAATAPQTIQVGRGGISRSPRPTARPVRLASSSATVATDAVPQSGALEVSPGSIPAGTRLVQFGAYDSPELARSEWDKLALRFEDILQGKQRVVQKAQSGGKTFYRLRAMGFTDLSDTRRFCAALVAENAACIPATAR